MSTDADFESQRWHAELTAMASAVRDRSLELQDHPLALLELLRILENLHREIREGLFQESLPDNRQDLYALLRDIEAEGGWPYIARPRLRSLLVNISPQHDEDLPAKD